MEQSYGSTTKMTRQDLILKIISLYPDTFRADRPDHVQSWVEMYEKAIRRNWDMEKLMWFFATNYKSTTVPPPPSFFYAYKEDVRPRTRPMVEEPPVMTAEEIEASRKAREEFFRKFKELKEKISTENI